MRKDFDIEFTTGLKAKKSPDFKDVTHKATAGVSEKDLIERNTIGKFEEAEDEPEQSEPKL